MRKYMYKNIHVYMYWGTWNADYKHENGRQFALHRCCCKTKKVAYEIAKKEVDFLNESK